MKRESSSVLFSKVSQILWGGRGGEADREESKIPNCLDRSLPNSKDNDTNSAIHDVKLCISEDGVKFREYTEETEGHWYLKE